MYKHPLASVAVAAIVATAAQVAGGNGVAADLIGIPCAPAGATDSRSDDYTIDDGTGDVNLGLVSGGTLVWLNQFQAFAGAEHIQRVNIAWGEIDPGRIAKIMIFADPNNDGDPQDITPAQLLWASDVVVDYSDSDIFSEYPADAHVGSAGSYFFVGVCCDNQPGEYPARLDQTNPMQRSWTGGGATGADCTDPNEGELGLLDRIDAYGYPGNWMIRAQSCVLMPGSSGACCLPNGLCVDTYAVNCGDWLHGVWIPCTSCGGVDCPDVAACCLADGSCQLLTDFGCRQEGGETQAPGSSCDANPCTPVPVEVVNWGRMKSIFR